MVKACKHTHTKTHTRDVHKRCAHLTQRRPAQTYRDVTDLSPIRISLNCSLKVLDVLVNVSVFLKTKLRSNSFKHNFQTEDFFTLVVQSWNVPKTFQRSSMWEHKREQHFQPNPQVKSPEDQLVKWSVNLIAYSFQSTDCECAGVCAGKSCRSILI